MKKSLFEYVILLHPTADQAKEGISSKILVEQTTILAKDDKEASIHASRAIPEKDLDNLDQIDIIVRPF